MEVEDGRGDEGGNKREDRMRKNGGEIKEA